MQTFAETSKFKSATGNVFEAMLLAAKSATDAEHEEAADTYKELQNLFSVITAAEKNPKNRIALANASLKYDEFFKNKIVGSTNPVIIANLNS